MPTALNPNTVVASTSDQVSTEVKGETVLLQLKNGKYYSLNRVGSVVWARLNEPTAVADVVDAVVKQFDVERAQCERDVMQLLGLLEDAGFVEVRT